MVVAGVPIANREDKVSSKHIGVECGSAPTSLRAGLLLLVLAFGLGGAGCSSTEDTGDDETGSSLVNAGNTPTTIVVDVETESASGITDLGTEPEDAEQGAAEPPFEPDDFPIPANVDLASVTDLVLITGQSNALGALTTFDAELDQPNDRVYAFTDVGWQVANLEQVWDMTHPGNFSTTDPERDPFNNFGFHFAKTIAENRSDRTVAFVLITAPGQEIAHWDTDREFFGQIRNKALNALNQVPHKSSFDGILWHQGESDAEDSDYYTIKLNELISNFRSEPWFGFERPFICGETIGLPVNNRLNMLNTDGDPWTACVAGEGLPSLEDGIHFSADGLRIIGERYGWQFITMRPRP